MDVELRYVTLPSLRYLLACLYLLQTTANYMGEGKEEEGKCKVGRTPQTF